jgi:hypothetical protein
MLPTGAFHGKCPFCEKVGLVVDAFRLVFACFDCGREGTLTALCPDPQDTRRAMVWLN